MVGVLCSWRVSLLIIIRFFTQSLCNFAQSASLFKSGKCVGTGPFRFWDFRVTYHGGGLLYTDVILRLSPSGRLMSVLVCGRLLSFFASSAVFGNTAAFQHWKSEITLIHILLRTLDS